MKKNILAIAAVTAMLAANLAACGSSAPATTTAAAETTAAEAAAAETEKAEETEAAPVEAVTLKFAVEMADETPEAIASYEFAEKVEEQTGGAVKIEVYTNGQLGEPATVIESAQMGNVDLLSLPASDFKSFDNIFGVEAIPYLYANNEAVIKVLKETGIADTQKQILADNGLTLLNEGRDYFRGPYRVLVSKKPVRSIEDLKGLRFRTFENKNYMTAYEILGANPIVIAWSETYMALQNGVAEAATSAIGSLKNQKLTEVAPYVTNVNEYVSSVLILASGSKYDSISEENKAILKKCADELGERAQELVNEGLEKDIEEMKAAGAEFIDIDTKPAREALKDFYYTLEEDGTLPKGTVDVVLAQ